jgi:hypothetical protein
MRPKPFSNAIKGLTPLDSAVKTFRSTVALFGVVLVAEKALHMALLVVHAVLGLPHIVRPMALNRIQPMGKKEKCRVESDEAQ